jgi:geranylgeranyl pyrophosphate synthase
VLNLVSESRDKTWIMSLIRQADKQEAFKEIRQRFIDSEAFIKTKEDVKHYIQRARRSINPLSESCFKESLFALADYIVEKL